jgi:Ca2+-binding RTX toxin-like protein
VGPFSITGPEAGVTISGADRFTVFSVWHDVTATLNGLTISHSLGNESGGGIDNAGRLTLIDCNVTDNTSDVGAGIHSYQVTVHSSAPHGPSSWRGSFTGPVSRIVASGGAGNDVIHLSGTTTADAWLDGGVGNDILTAGRGNNVLLGGAGNDILHAGRGRDLLIGGGGTDILLAQGGDDLLLGGACDFATSERALSAVMKEWSRTDADYATRVGHLTGTLSNGQNAGYFLDAATLEDDEAPDLLVGNGDLDLFFASADDLVVGHRHGEVVVKV